MTWVADENGNRASVERWGSEEAARASLKTLDGCSDCYDCSRCSGCSDCYDLKDAAPSGDTPVPLYPVPVVADLHKRIYMAASAPAGLDMCSWHTCANTHCRAGWAVALAGVEGKALENRFGTCLAAMKIYDASCRGFQINPCRFFDDNEAALEDMRKLAESL